MSRRSTTEPHLAPNQKEYSLNGGMRTICVIVTEECYYYYNTALEALTRFIPLQDA